MPVSESWESIIFGTTSDAIGVETGAAEMSDYAPKQRLGRACEPCVPRHSC